MKGFFGEVFLTIPAVTGLTDLNVDWDHCPDRLFGRDKWSRPTLRSIWRGEVNI